MCNCVCAGVSAYVCVSACPRTCKFCAGHWRKLRKRRQSCDCVEHCAATDRLNTSPTGPRSAIKINRANLV